jgi:hypothetical protein
MHHTDTCAAGTYITVTGARRAVLGGKPKKGGTMKNILMAGVLLLCVATAEAAVCTGGTATALQSCLNAARTSGDKVVEVQGSPWTIDTQIWVPHFVTLRGPGSKLDGVQFNITYGQYGDPWNGAIAAIMLAKGSVLDGIAIYYPNQVPVDQTMIQYAPAVGLWRDGGSSGVWGTEAIDEVQVRRCTF